jgi:hypothetical protein
MYETPACIRKEVNKNKNLKGWCTLSTGLPDFSWNKIPKQEKYTK